MIPGDLSKPSILDPNNLANYTPIKVTWEVQGKRGCCWVNLASYKCLYDTTAAKKAHDLYPNYKLLRVRNASTLGVDPGPWRKFRYGQTTTNHAS